MEVSHTIAIDTTNEMRMILMHASEEYTGILRGISIAGAPKKLHAP